MPLKRLLELFTGTLSWGFSLHFSGLSTVMAKKAQLGTKPKRIELKDHRGA